MSAGGSIANCDKNLTQLSLICLATLTVRLRNSTMGFGTKSWLSGQAEINRGSFTLMV